MKYSIGSIYLISSPAVIMTYVIFKVWICWFFFRHQKLEKKNAIAWKQPAGVWKIWYQWISWCRFRGYDILCLVESLFHILLVWKLSKAKYLGFFWFSNSKMVILSHQRRIRNQLNRSYSMNHPVYYMYVYRIQCRCIQSYLFFTTHFLFRWWCYSCCYYYCIFSRSLLYLCHSAPRVFQSIPGIVHITLIVHSQ